MVPLAAPVGRAEAAMVVSYPCWCRHGVLSTSIGCGDTVASGGYSRLQQASAGFSLIPQCAGCGCGCVCRQQVAGAMRPWPWQKQIDGLLPPSQYGGPQGKEGGSQGKEDRSQGKEGHFRPFLIAADSALAIATHLLRRARHLLKAGPPTGWR
jgi:hypothetical protein